MSHVAGFRSCLLIVLGCLSTALSGCSLMLDLHGGLVLNRRAQAASAAIGRSVDVSEILEVAIFQLKTVPEEKQQALVNKVKEDWSKFRLQLATDRAKGKYPESFAPYLALPETVLEIKRPDELFVIKPGERFQREISLSVWTSHLLVITLGSELGLRSVQLLDVGGTTGATALCFSGYDVQRYELGKLWTCPQIPNL